MILALNAAGAGRPAGCSRPNTVPRAFAPKIARAEGRDPRLLTLCCAARMMGLAAVAPVGNPDGIGLLGDKALTLDGAPGAWRSIPLLPQPLQCPICNRLYTSGAATIGHACANPLTGALPFRRHDVLEAGCCARRLGNRMAQLGP